MPTVEQLQNQLNALRRVSEMSMAKMASDMAALRTMLMRGGAVDGGDEFAHIPGRRIWYNLVGSVAFTITQNGVAGEAIAFQISQDGPFIMTHFPVIMWRPNLPTNATNFGKWRPVASGPLPTQQLATDFIDLSYTLEDTGPGRLLQNARVPPVSSLFNQPVRLPRPTMLEPNSTLVLTPTFEDIDFNSTGTATTGGLLTVAFPGYKIITGGAAGVFLGTVNQGR